MKHLIPVRCAVCGAWCEYAGFEEGTHARFGLCTLHEPTVLTLSRPHQRSLFFLEAR